MKQIKVGKKGSVEFTQRTDENINKYLNDISSISKPISPELELELIEKAQRGDMVARDRLIYANLRFIFSVAKQYQGRGIPLSDLINEGNMGFIRAINKFDINSGFKLISYAVWHIRQAIIQHIQNLGEIVRLPINRQSQMSKIKNIKKEFAMKNGRELTNEELPDDLQDEALKYLTISKSSLDRKLSDYDEGSSTLADMILVTSDDVTMETIYNEDFQKVLMKSINKLTPRHKEAIMMKYGINTHEHTLEEIREKFDISKIQARSLINKAHKHLRIYLRKSNIKELL